MAEPRILIVAENVSAKFGGEAFLPLHYFRVLRSRGIEAFILTHERVRNELDEAFPNERDRLFYVPDQRVQVALWYASSVLPSRLSEFTFGSATHLASQFAQRQVARRLVKEKRITVVHEPAPVSPKLPSAMYDLGAPVVIGPMNGGMQFPAGFRDMQSGAERRALAWMRRGTDLANRLIPGKRRAATLLVANGRTRDALPECTRHVPIVELTENGVDLSRFVRSEEPARRGDPAVRFAFVGRLVAWKAVNLLLAALAGLPAALKVELEVFGDGPERSRLKSEAERLGLGQRVHFHGFVPQQEAARRLAALDGLILPSLYECGGAVVLEAMATGLPVIATRWGGPADYLDEHCGVLIEPSDRESFIRDLRAAVHKLATDEALRRSMGAAGRAKVEAKYDWERKVDRVLEVYQQVGVAQPARATEATAKDTLSGELRPTGTAQPEIRASRIAPKRSATHDSLRSMPPESIPALPIPRARANRHGTAGY